MSATGRVHSPDEFWKLLQDGRSGIVRVPAERWDADAFYSEDHTVPGTICTREGGFLTSWQPDEFDAEFFGICPARGGGDGPAAAACCSKSPGRHWRTRASHRTPSAAPKPRRFVGLTTNDYSLTFADSCEPEDIDAYVPFGNAANFAAGRLSYFLGRARPGGGHRHGVFVVAGVDAPGLSEPAPPRKRHRAGRRRQPDAEPGEQHRLLAVGDVVARRPVQDLRCRRRRLCAQ